MAWRHDCTTCWSTARGQFFKPHQDTEKHPGMIATLVLVWPSAQFLLELPPKVALAAHELSYLTVQ